MLKSKVLAIGAGGNNAGISLLKLGLIQKDSILLVNSTAKDIPAEYEDIAAIYSRAFGGAAKERSAAKRFLKDSIMSIINDKELDKIFDVDVIFVVSSTGGGTGSGTAPIMANILQSTFADVKTILVGVLPVNSEALSSHVNTLEYLNELYSTLSNQTYMLYDNDKLSKLPSTTMMQTINESIVNDIDVIRGTYKLPTNFSSID